MVKVVAINPHKKGVFIVHYEKHSACGCTPKTRHTILMNQTKKPTEAQALIYINNNES